MAALSTAIRAGRAFIELFVNDSRLVRGLRQAENQVRKFGANIQAIGRSLFNVGAMASAPFGLSVKTFANFDDQMRAVKSSIGATEQEFEQLTAKAKFLGRTTSFTATQVAGAMLELGRAGFDSKMIDAAMESVLDLARATETDLAESTEMAVGTMFSFGLSANEMARVCDVMVAAANGASMTFTDLGEAMSYCAPIASEYGLTLEQTAKAIGSLSNYNIKASMAGTTLRTVLTNLADPTIQKRLQELGVSVVDWKTRKLRDVSEILRDLGKNVRNMPKDQKLGLFKELFGMYAIAGGAKLTVAQFDKLIDDVDNARGIASRTAKEMDSGLGGSFRMLWSAVEGVAIAVGDALAPTLKKMSDGFTAACSGVAEYVSEHKELIVKVAKTIAIIMAAGTALFVMGLAFIGVAKAIGGIATAISSIAKVAILGLNTIQFGVNTISGAFTALSFTIGSFVSVFSAVASGVIMAFAGVAAVVGGVLSVLGTAIGAILSPIGLVIIGIVAIAGVCFMMSRSVETVEDVFSYTFESIANAVRIAISGLSWLGSLFSSVFNAIGEIVTGFGNFFMDAFNGVGEAIQWLRNRFTELCSFATETFSAIAAAVSRGDIEAAIGVIWATIKLIWVKGSIFLLSTWSWVVESLQAAWANCVYKISEILVKAWAGVQSFWAETVYTMSTIWTVFSSGVVSAWKAAEKAVLKGIRYLVAQAQGLDFEVISKKIDEDYNAKAKQREADKTKSLNKIQKERDAKISLIDTEKTGTLDMLKEDFKRNEEMRNTDSESRIADQEQELLKARQEYEAAIHKAKNPQPGADFQETPIGKMLQKVNDFFSNWKDQGGIANNIRTSSSGTFSGTIARGLGSGTVINRIAQGVEKTAKYVEQTAKNTDPNKKTPKATEEDDTSPAKRNKGIDKKLVADFSRMINNATSRFS